jgi:hypothetical protein
MVAAGCGSFPRRVGILPRVIGFLELADGRRFPLHDGLTIGRVAGCDIVIGDTKASRRHAKVVVEGNVAEVEDLGSSNGTLLNGKPVTKRVLRPGDEIQIGTTVIRFVEGAAMPAAPASAGNVPGPGSKAPAFADEDDDLFSGSAPGAGPASPATPVPPRAATPPPPPRAPAPPPAAPAIARATPPAPPVPPPVAAPVPPPPPPPPRQVVEFADEVVEVRKAAPPTEVTARSSSSPAAAPAGIQQKSRVLQFSQNVDTGNRLRDDIGQMTSGTRALVYAGVIAGSGGIIWLMMYLMG